MEIQVGKNKHHNWELIDAAEPHDLWFHVDNMPSSHCILVTQGQKADRTQKKRAAVLCKQHSKAKSLKNIEINYTEICNVQKDIKSGPGAVILKCETKSIWI